MMNFFQAEMNPHVPANQMEGIGMLSNALQASHFASTGINMNPNSNGYESQHAGFDPSAAYLLYLSLFPPDNSSEMPPVKKTITLSSCVLYPPDPRERIKSKKRYPGCKTAFVSGLPEKISEEIICEIFSQCGKIDSISMRMKNFCHVRFTSEADVDEAMKLSGYRLKVENRDGSGYSNKLHIEYAKPREDEYERECSERRVDGSGERPRKSRPTSPLPVVYFTPNQAKRLAADLKKKEHFKSAAHVLTTWLERGDCNRTTCHTFYNLIHTTNNHLKILLNKRSILDKKLSEAEKPMQEKITFISVCLNEIRKVFETVRSSPAIMNSFTKAQKKEIELMRQNTLDVMNIYSRELIEERVEDEMELSEGEEEDRDLPENRSDCSSLREVSREEVQKLSEDVEELRKRYQNAVDRNAVIKREIESCSYSYSKTLQEKKEEALALGVELSKLEQFNEDFFATLNAASTQKDAMQSSSLEECGNILRTITQREMSLITLIATFLIVHPSGASIDRICTYLMKADSNVDSKDVESLLERYPFIFSKNTSEIYGTEVTNWKYLGFYP